MNALNSIFKSLVALLFPDICPVCEKGLITGERFICSSCLVDFPFTDADYLFKKEKSHPVQETLSDCIIYSLFYYSKYSRYKNLIYAIKYHSQRKLAFYLGQMLGERLVKTCQADCIIPVPLHYKREKARGFNQAEEIAQGVGSVLGIEMLGDVMRRVCDNPSQTGKNFEERLKNTEHIFSLDNRFKIAGKHILLIDDVITTGATMASCIDLLRNIPDVKISIACLARTEMG